MSELVPHLVSETGARIAGEVYADAQMFRVPLRQCTVFRKHLPAKTKLWIDCEFDGCHDIARSAEDDSWYGAMSSLPHFAELEESGFRRPPPQKKVDELVAALMTRATKQKPTWLSVPQLPLTEGAERNKTNLSLAKAAARWKHATKFKGRLILPLIFTHQKLLNKKTDRNPKVKQAARCYTESQASGYWAVDMSLVDDSGSKTLRDKRLPGVIALHEELEETLAPEVSLAGPYWALTLVLWSRRLVSHPLIGTGTGYQYFLPGGTLRSSKARIAIADLRRRATVSNSLNEWLEEALAEIGESHPSRAELLRIKKKLSVFADRTKARRQVAVFYKVWFDKIASNPPSGRSMAMFQDLSSAYALGKSLPDLKDEGTARKAASVVEPFMTSCL